MHNPFRYFNSSPEVIRLAVMMYVRYPLSLRQVEDLLCERGIDICHETVRCFRHQLLLPRPYLVLTKPLSLDIQCQRAASVKIGWKYLDD